MAAETRVSRSACMAVGGTNRAGAGTKKGGLRRPSGPVWLFLRLVSGR